MVNLQVALQSESGSESISSRCLATQTIAALCIWTGLSKNIVQYYSKKHSEKFRHITNLGS